jgi:GR25 family glycosyltransferase involved in LPS biosynthesis
MSNVVDPKLLLCALGLLLLLLLSFQTYEEVFYNPPNFLPIHIVSLPSRKAERLDPLLARIRPSPLYGVRSVVSVDGKKEVTETFLNQGQIGCWLSHAKIWRQIEKQTENYALVLEDDALVSLPEMLDEIHGIVSKMPLDWSVCYLGGVYQDKSSAVQILQRLFRSDSSVIWHSHAYLLTREAAKKLLEMSVTFNNSFNKQSFDNVLPVDDWMTNPNRSLKVFLVSPELVPFVRDNISDTR